MPNANSLMSTIFPGISFPPTVFPPLIDMSSTQALVTLVWIKIHLLLSLMKIITSCICLVRYISFYLCSFGFLQARAAKEAELQQILKGPVKRPIQSSPSSNNQNANHLRQQSPSRLASQSLANLSYMQKSPLARVPLNSANLSAASDHPHLNNQLRGRASSPLDLSSSTPISKRLKMESPSPVRSVGSPPSGNHHHLHNISLTSVVPQQQQPSRTQSNASLSPGPTNSSTGSTTTVATNNSNHQTQRRCHAQSDEINSWTVNQVCDFVGCIDICAEYVDVSNQSILYFRFNSQCGFLLSMLALIPIEHL